MYNLNYSVSKKQPCYRINKKLINTEPIKLNKIKDKFNGIQITNFHNRSTEPWNYRIYALPQSIK